MADNREMRRNHIFLGLFEATRYILFVKTYFVALVLLHRTRTSAKRGKFFDTSSETSKWAGSPIFGLKNDIDTDVMTHVKKQMHHYTRAQLFGKTIF